MRDETTQQEAPIASGVTTHGEQLGAREPAAVRDRSAGEVIIAVVIAVLLGGLLNAQDVLATAERQELGRTRDIALTFAEPLAAVSSALWLDRPRAAIEQAMGRSDGPAGEDPVVAAPDESEAPSDPAPSADPTSEPTAAPEPTDEPEPEPEPEPTQEPITAANPLTMYVGGDSMVGQFGVAMDDLASDTGVVEVTEVRYEFGSGISRPDFIDWPAVLAEVSATQDPDVMVLYFGGNDAQPLEIDGTVRQPEDPEWQEEYRQRVSDLMDQLVAAGHRVYWMGMPIARSPDLQVKHRMLNEIYSSEAEARPQVTYVDVWELFAGPDGEFSEYLPNQNGDVVDMRLDDGIHLTTAGAYRAARPAMARIMDDFDIEPPADE
ncbi:MAG TPA: DUF459 domain-containing protein [Egicoccus sp.]|nr:DUF459 domain-containing protein [Egicoccus sp.]HSK24896.1 DUF459 domain-containing protein [Egicoccus sp.]